MDLGAKLRASAAGDVSLDKEVEGYRDQDQDERQDQRLILGPSDMGVPHRPKTLVFMAGSP
jgi:hypothetical protein